MPHRSVSSPAVMVLLEMSMTATPSMPRFVESTRFFSLEAKESWTPVRLGQERALELAEEAAMRGLGVFHLDGTRMSNRSGLFGEFSNRLQFPDYFGSNWNALDECLADLDWLDLPGYLLVIDSSRSVLSDEGTEVRRLFNGLLEDISGEWARSDPGIIFRTILSPQRVSTEVL